MHILRCFMTNIQINYNLLKDSQSYHCNIKKIMYFPLYSKFKKILYIPVSYTHLDVYKRQIL